MKKWILSALVVIALVAVSYFVFTGFGGKEARGSFIGGGGATIQLAE